MVEKQIGGRCSSGLFVARQDPTNGGTSNLQRLKLCYVNSTSPDAPAISYHIYNFDLCRRVLVFSL